MSRDRQGWIGRDGQGWVGRVVQESVDLCEQGKSGMCSCKDNSTDIALA